MHLQGWNDKVRRVNSVWEGSWCYYGKKLMGWDPPAPRIQLTSNHNLWSIKKKILVYHWTWKKNLSCHPHHSKASGKISPAQSSRTVHFAHTVQPLGKSIVSFQRYLLSSTTKYSSIHHIQGEQKQKILSSDKETENIVLWGAWDITSR